MNQAEFLIYLISRYGYKSYLEIGISSGDTFNSVACEDKTGVDPNVDTTFKMTSDDFFSQNEKTFDLIFVDGLHLAEQSLKDVKNSLRFLNKGGTIVMHDCRPRHEIEQRRKGSHRHKFWTGDVWKAFVQIRKMPDIDAAVFDTDWGLGVVVPKANTQPLIYEGPLDWGIFVERRNELLRLMDFEEMQRFLP